MRKRSLRTLLALFFILFALLDISFAGACCGDETDSATQNDATCFCCCSHVTIETNFVFETEYLEQQMPINNVPGTTYSHHSIVYRPPKTT
ncbi:MAG TPA: hypothetical protein VLH08_12510 [Acidobacteriota bacterium]|nr:hypothetical protein [Acidobacteriota bacterium]